MTNLRDRRAGRPLRGWVRMVAVLTVVSLLMAIDPLHGQQRPEEASDLFGSVQRNLNEAADVQLAAIQMQHRSQGNAASGIAPNMKFNDREIESPSGSFPAKGVSATSFEPRFQSMGVDASRIFGEVGVPAEYLAVAQVESNFNPAALSPKGAFGLWQLMPSTARRYGLRVDSSRDDRADPEKATRAAARYLRDLYVQFGDWLLALAAYNAGEDLVQKAVERGGTADFWSLSDARQLPKETRNYVPAVLAAVRLGDSSGTAFREQDAVRGATKGAVLFAVPFTRAQPMRTKLISLEGGDSSSFPSVRLIGKHLGRWH